MTFTWSAPDACPIASDVQARVEEKLAGPLELGDRTLAVTVTRDGDAYVARIALDDGDPRTLEDASCDELADAVVVIATRLATEHRAEVVAPKTPPSTPQPSVAQPSPRHGVRIAARVAGVGAVGVLPGVGVGGEVAALAELGPLSADIAFEQWATRSQTVMWPVDHVDVGLRAVVARAGVRIGPLPLRATVDLEAGTMSGHGMYSGGGRWLAVGVGVAGWWQLTSSLRVVAATEGDSARERVRFTGADGALVYEPGSTSARLMFGLEVQIP